MKMKDSLNIKEKKNTYTHTHTSLWPKKLKKNLTILQDLNYDNNCFFLFLISAADCVDSHACANEMLFQKSYCKTMPNKKYAKLNGEKYTPLELCPKTCGQC